MVRAHVCLLLCWQYLRSTLGGLVIGILESEADFEVILLHTHVPYSQMHTHILHIISAHVRARVCVCTNITTCTALQVDPTKLPSGASLEANQKQLEKLVWDTWRAITASHEQFPRYVCS